MKSGNPKLKLSVLDAYTYSETNAPENLVNNFAQELKNCALQMLIHANARINELQIEFDKRKPGLQK